jgi:hypothetical protein
MRKNVVIKHDGKASLERPRHRCEDNIKMDLTEIGFEFVAKLDQWRTPVNMVVHFP